MTGEQVVSKVLTGLIGFSIVSMIAVIALLMVCIVGWFLSRWILKRALNRAGVPVTGLIFVPLAGTYHMVSKLGLTGAFKFFGITISAIVPELFVFVNLIGVLFLPTVLKLALVFVGWFLNGAVYTRVWDLADGKVDGESSLWGLLSAMIPIIFFVKILIMAFSGKAPEAVAQQTEQAPKQPVAPAVSLSKPTQPAAPHAQQVQPVIQQVVPQVQPQVSQQSPVQTQSVQQQDQSQQESIIPQHSVLQPFNPEQPIPTDQPRSSVRLQQLQPQVQQQSPVQELPEGAKPNSIFL